MSLCVLVLVTAYTAWYADVNSLLGGVQYGRENSTIAFCASNDVVGTDPLDIISVNTIAVGLFLLAE